MGPLVRVLLTPNWTIRCSTGKGRQAGQAQQKKPKDPSKRHALFKKRYTWGHHRSFFWAAASAFALAPRRTRSIHGEAIRYHRRRGGLPSAAPPHWGIAWGRDLGASVVCLASEFAAAGRAFLNVASTSVQRCLGPWLCVYCCATGYAERKKLCFLSVAPPYRASRADRNLRGSRPCGRYFRLARLASGGVGQGGAAIAHPQDDVPGSPEQVPCHREDGSGRQWMCQASHSHPLPRLDSDAAGLP